MTNIYILKLKNNKYYIGKTNNIKLRLLNHNKGNGSQWTKKYKPIKVIEIIEDCDNWDEDKYTLQYMNKYGIDNVRGGSFCQLLLSNENKITINKMILGNTDKCYKCGEVGHYIKDCKKKKNREFYFYCNICNKKYNCLSNKLKHENNCNKKKTNYI